MEEYAMGIMRSAKRKTVADIVKLCIKTEFGLLNGCKPDLQQFVSILAESGYAEIAKY